MSEQRTSIELNLNPEYPTDYLEVDGAWSFYEQITENGGVEIALASSPVDTASINWIAGPTTAIKDSDGTSIGGGHLHFEGDHLG